jgi:uncharacterized protein YqeY
MELITTIEQDIKTAMKDRDTDRLETLRAIRSEFTTLEKSGTDVTEAQLIAKLQKMSKVRHETAAVFAAAERSDLAFKEMAEANIIEAYLPKKMAEEDVISLTLKVAAENHLTFIKQNMGKIVKLTVDAANGGTDGKVVSGIVTTIINAATAN